MELFSHVNQNNINIKNIRAHIHKRTHKRKGKKASRIIIFTYGLYFNKNLNKNFWIRKCVLHLTMHMLYYKVESHNLKRAEQTWSNIVFDKIQKNLD